MWRASFAGLNSGDFEKRAIRNPARIPPQTQYERIYWVFVLSDLSENQ